MKVHLHDDVLVTVGKDRGKKGKVIRILSKAGKIVVEKINIRTRHIKKKPGQPGQKIQYEAPIQASNIMVLCPNCNKPTRVGYVVLETGKKQRVCKKCSQSVDKSIEKIHSKKH